MRLGIVAPDPLVGRHFKFDIVEGEVQLINITPSELRVGNNPSGRVVGIQANGTRSTDRIFQLGRLVVI